MGLVSRFTHGTLHSAVLPIVRLSETLPSDLLKSGTLSSPQPHASPPASPLRQFEVTKDEDSASTPNTQNAIINMI